MNLPGAAPATGYIKQLFKAPLPSDAWFPSPRQRYHIDSGSLNGRGLPWQLAEVKKNNKWGVGLRGRGGGREPHTLTEIPVAGRLRVSLAPRSCCDVWAEGAGRIDHTGSGREGVLLAVHRLTQSHFWCSRARLTCHCEGAPSLARSGTASTCRVSFISLFCDLPTIRVQSRVSSLHIMRPEVETWACEPCSVSHLKD